MDLLAGATGSVSWGTRRDSMTSGKFETVSFRPALAKPLTTSTRAVLQGDRAGAIALLHISSSI